MRREHIFINIPFMVLFLLAIGTSVRESWTTTTTDTSDAPEVIAREDTDKLPNAFVNGLYEYSVDREQENLALFTGQGGAAMSYQPLMWATPDSCMREQDCIDRQSTIVVESGDPIFDEVEDQEVPDGEPGDTDNGELAQVIDL